MGSGTWRYDGPMIIAMPMHVLNSTLEGVIAVYLNDCWRRNDSRPRAFEKFWMESIVISYAIITLRHVSKMRRLTLIFKLNPIVQAFIALHVQNVRSTVTTLLDTAFLTEIRLRMRRLMGDTIIKNLEENLSCNVNFDNERELQSWSRKQDNETSLGRKQMVLR